MTFTRPSYAIRHDQDEVLQIVRPNIPRPGQYTGALARVLVLGAWYLLAVVAGVLLGGALS